MEKHRRTARIAGILYLVTFATSIPAVILYGPVINDPGYILGAGSDTRVRLGALLEILLAIANIGTGVVLYPVLQRQSRSLALGYVAARIVESTVIVVGVISFMAITLLRSTSAGSGDDSTLRIAGQALAAVHNRTFLLGPGFCVAVGNGCLLGTLMYTSRLVPRAMSVFGLIGGPLLFVASTLVLFGALRQTDLQAFLLTIPEIVWELSLGIYLIAKGFRRSPLLHAGAEGGVAHTET